MKTIIHVNQHIIKQNSRRKESKPPLTIKDYKRNRKACRADIVVDGQVVATVVYRPDNPLPCGARCWVETHFPVVADYDYQDTKSGGKMEQEVPSPH